MNEPVLGRLQHLMTLREDVESLTSGGPWVPAADWYESDTHMTLCLDVPGVQPGSLELLEEDGTVTVTGERDVPERRLLAERPGGRFTRTLTFPLETVPQSGEAQLAGGVLQVHFEKRHPTIEITARAEREAES